MRYTPPGIVGLALAVIAAEAAGRKLPRLPVEPEPPKPDMSQRPLSRQARRKASRRAAKGSGA